MKIKFLIPLLMLAFIGLSSFDFEGKPENETGKTNPSMNPIQDDNNIVGRIIKLVNLVSISEDYKTVSESSIEIIKEFDKLNIENEALKSKLEEAFNAGRNLVDLEWHKMEFCTNNNCHKELNYANFDEWILLKR